MNDEEVIIARYALDILEQCGAGLPAKPLMDQTERMSHRILTTVERQKCLRILEEKEWVYTYRDRISDQVNYAISDQGRVAREGM